MIISRTLKHPPWVKGERIYRIEFLLGILFDVMVFASRS